MKTKCLITVMMLLLVSLFLLSCGSKTENTIESGASSSDAMFRADFQRTGNYNIEGVQQLNGVEWKFQTGGALVSSPAVADGVVFCGSNDKYIYALH